MVIGQDGVVVFVRHGGTYVQVHQSRLRKVDDPQTVTPANDEPLNAEDDSEPPASVLPGGDNLDQSGQPHTGKILSRAGKATGKHKNWYNLQYSEPEEIAGRTGSVYLGQMDSVQAIPSEHAKLSSDYNEDDTLDST